MHTIPCAMRAGKRKGRKCNCEEKNVATDAVFRIETTGLAGTENIRRDPHQPRNGTKEQSVETQQARVQAYACEIKEGKEECSAEKERAERDSQQDDEGLEEMTKEVSNRKTGESADEGNAPDAQLSNNGHPSTLQSTGRLSRKRKREPAWNEWTRDDEWFQETDYKYRRVMYMRKDVSRPATTKGERRTEDICMVPEIISLLGKDGPYNEQTPRFELTREEIVRIMSWIDNLPEYQKGGKQLLLYRTPQGTLAVTDMRKREGEEGESEGESLRVLELERDRLGQLREIPGPQSNSREEFPTDALTNPGSEKADRQRSVPQNLNSTELEDGRKTTGAGIRIFATLVESRAEQATENANETPEEEMKKKVRSPEENYKGIGKEIAERFPLPHGVRILSKGVGGVNGLLAAREWIPLAQYSRERDIGFYARGATAVWGEGEEERHCRGNALVRMTQYDLEHTPKFPSRRRVSFYRKYLFRMKIVNNSEDKNTENEPENETQFHKNASLPENNPERAKTPEEPAEGSGEAMTKEELMAAVNELAEDPIDGDNETRTYEMRKDPSGVVVVTRLPHSHALAQKFEKEMEERMERDERETRTWNVSPVETSELGSDPHTSEDRSAGQRENLRNEGEDLEESLGNGRATEWRMTRPQGPKTQGDRTGISESSESINKPQATYQEGCLTQPALQESPPSTTQQQPICIQPMNNPHPPRPPLQPLRALAATCDVRPQPVHRGVFDANPEGPQHGVDPGVGQCRPGLIAATHLTQTLPKDLPPPARSFFGYNAIIAEEKAGGEVITHHGHILVHLYIPVSPNSASTPPLPPPDRIEATRRQLFRIETPIRRPPGFRPHDVAHADSPLPNPRTEPSPAKVNTPPRGGRAGESENPEETAVKAMVSLRDSRRSNDTNLQLNGIPSQPETTKGPANIERRDPQSRRIEFVSGGILPGTAPNQGPIMGEQSKTLDQASNATVQRNSPVKPAAASIAPPKEGGADDVEMAQEDDPDYDSLPELVYLDSEDDENPLQPQQSSERNKAAVRTNEASGSAPTKPTPIPAPRNDPSRAQEPFATPRNTCIEYRRWQENLEPAAMALKAGAGWTDGRVRDAFEKSGMLSWWMSLCMETAQGREVNWMEWKERMLKIWMERYPESLPTTIRWMADDLERLDSRAKVSKVLAAKREMKRMEEDEEGEEDVEMTMGDVPRDPNSTPTPTYAQRISQIRGPYSPAKVASSLMDYRVQAEGLEGRIVGLERRVDQATREIEKRLEDMEDQMVEDNNNLTLLGWRTTALEDGKKENPTGWRETAAPKRGRGRTRNQHGHWTRGIDAQGGVAIQVTKKEYGEIEKKMRKTEERLDRQRREAQELREEMAKVKALAAKISELSDTFQKFQANQERINRAVSQEITELRSRVNGEVTPTLEAHAQVLTGLNARYTSIYNIATGLISQQSPGRSAASPNVSLPAHSTFATGVPPTGTSYYRPTQVPATGNSSRQPLPIRKAIAV